MGAMVTSVHRGKDREVGRGIVKVVGLCDTTTNRLCSVFVVAVDNGGQLDLLARATGLATSPSLHTSTAATSSLWSNRLGWAGIMATHLMCPLLPLLNPLLSTLCSSACSSSIWPSLLGSGIRSPQLDS